MALSVSTPKHLHAIGLLDQDTNTHGWFNNSSLNIVNVKIVPSNVACESFFFQNLFLYLVTFDTSVLLTLYITDRDVSQIRGSFGDRFM